MCDISTIIKYPLLIMLSIGKKSFENMGRNSTYRYYEKATVTQSFYVKIILKIIS